MSQDKLVTPETSILQMRSSWVERSLSLATVQSLRRQNIRKIHGSVRRTLSRCGCGDSGIGSVKDRRAFVCGLLEPTEPVREVLLATPCRLAPVLWITLIPDGGMFSWCEVIEMTAPEFIASFIEPPAMREVRPRQVWEAMGSSDFKFKLSPLTYSSPDERLARARTSVIRETLAAHANISHINFSFDGRVENPDENLNNKVLDLPELEVEFLRKRFIPLWRQSGDMAYWAFSTYTVMRTVV